MKEINIKLGIPKSRLIWICAIIIIAAIVIVLIASDATMFGGIQSIEQATDTMTEVGSGISRISSTLEDIAGSLG
jgi:ABC-type cobalt transport system substrate-binding protein